MHNELNKKKGIWGGGIGSLDFWKMILTFGVWSSVSGNDDEPEPDEPKINVCYCNCR